MLICVIRGQRIFSGSHLLCIVPEKRTAEAVKNTLHGPIATSCPSSILRRQANAILFVDQEAASELDLTKLGQ